jgi:hypothetical protein
LQLLRALVRAFVAVDLRHYRLDLGQRLGYGTVISVRLFGALEELLEGQSVGSRLGEMAVDRMYVPLRGEDIYKGAAQA